MVSEELWVWGRNGHLAVGIGNEKGGKIDRFSKSGRNEKNKCAGEVSYWQ